MAMSRMASDQGGVMPDSGTAQPACRYIACRTLATLDVSGATPLSTMTG